MDANFLESVREHLRGMRLFMDRLRADRAMMLQDRQRAIDKATKKLRAADQAAKKRKKARGGRE